MPLSQASTLCADATCIEHDPQLDLEALFGLAEAAHCFSPSVGIEPIDSELWAGRSLHQPQALLLDITGVAPLFGSETELASAVHRWLMAQGYVAAIAIASRVGTAWAMANYAFRSQLADRLLRSEQDGMPFECEPTIAILEDDESALSRLGNYSIEALRLDQATVTKLHRLGIRKISSLTELPRSGMASRLGERILERMDQALFDRSEPIVGLHAAPELLIEESLEHPTPCRETIDAILANQVETLTSRLSSMGHGAIRLVCRITLERNSIPVETQAFINEGNAEANIPTQVVHVFQVGLYQPSHEPEHLLWLLRGQLDSQANESSQPHALRDGWVHSLSLQATVTAPIHWQQCELFDRHKVLHRDAIAKLIDHLSARMGRSAIVSPQVHRDPQPELAFGWRPLTGWRNDGKLQETKRKLAKAPKRNFAEERSIIPSSQDCWRRPMRLHTPPRPLQVQQLDPNGAPLEFLIQGVRVQVANATGPERIDSGWWQGKTQQRDYFRLELANGAWIWVYHDRRDRTWFLHGEFD
jgi:protein ImuB